MVRRGHRIHVCVEIDGGGRKVFTTLGGVMSLLGVSRTTIQEWVKQGTYVKDGWVVTFNIEVE